jgi:hypothetical protein
MSKPLEICIEDLHAKALGEQYLKCVALPGSQPGLRVDRRGQVLWKSEHEVACELWVSGDDQLILRRPSGAEPVRVSRAGRSLDVPFDKPVVLLDRDDVQVGGRALRVHFHGFTEAIRPPSFLSESVVARMRQAAAAAAIATLGAGAACVTGGEQGRGTTPPAYVAEDAGAAAADSAARGSTRAALETGVDTGIDTGTGHDAGAAATNATDGGVDTATGEPPLAKPPRDAGAEAGRVQIPPPKPPPPKPPIEIRNAPPDMAI